MWTCQVGPEKGRKQSPEGKGEVEEKEKRKKNPKWQGSRRGTVLIKQNSLFFNFAEDQYDLFSVNSVQTNRR